MGDRHLEHLFSAAYDGDLGEAARRRFDAHLAGCPVCAPAWADYRDALEAVHALPVAPMPATVRLPAGPPRVGAHRPVRPGRWRAAPLHPQPRWAAAALTAAGLAAVAVAAHHGRPAAGTGTASPGSSSALSAGPGRPEALAAPEPRVLTTPSCAVTQVAPAGGDAVPAGFTLASRSPAGAGRELVLATPGRRVAAGTDIPVYARLTGAAAGPGGTDVVPCVTLQTAGGGGTAPAGPPAPAADGAGPRSPSGTAPAVPQAVAVAKPGTPDDAPAGARRQAPGGLLSVAVPAGLPPGTVLRLVAVVPAHAAGNPTGAPIVAELLVTVG
jgi:Putative zinc-finger